MTLIVALLRGVNLAGHRSVAMADLRALASALGLGDAQTLLNSGNLLFKPDRRSPATLERLLEVEAATRLGLKTDFHIRTATEWRALISANPFTAEAKRDPARLVVALLKKAPDAKAFTALQAAIKGREQVRGIGRHAYIYFPDGQGRSTLTTAVRDKALATIGTARNWNTVMKLAERLEA